MSFNRSDIGGWLNGPEVADTHWPGKSLGLPQDGPGSVAPLGRRVLGLLIDWFACAAISALAFNGDPVITLLLFWAEQVFFVGLFGMSLGHRLTGIHVTALDGVPAPLANAPYWVRILVRSTLLALFIPALIMNTDMRGLNDQAAGTAVLKR